MKRICTLIFFILVFAASAYPEETCVKDRDTGRVLFVGNIVDAHHVKVPRGREDAYIVCRGGIAYGNPAMIWLLHYDAGEQLLIYYSAEPLKIKKYELNAFTSDEHNLSRSLAEIPVEKRAAYERIIIPWLRKEFLKSFWVTEDGGSVRRKLEKTTLLRYENIEGQDRYNVHIEYHVHIIDSSAVVLDGLKGQEIVFWIKDGKVKDYFPFGEYWIKGEIRQEEII